MREVSMILSLEPGRDFTVSLDRITVSVLQRLTYIEAVMLLDMLCTFLMRRTNAPPLTCTPLYFVPQLEATRIVIAPYDDNTEYTVLDHAKMRALDHIVPLKSLTTTSPVYYICYITYSSSQLI